MKGTNDRQRIAWAIAEWVLFATWALDAALVMMHRRAGFFTAHAADLTIPAWLYVTSRSRMRTAASSWRRSIASAPPIILAGALLVASAATEVSQYFWPHGVFRGVFDPLDIAAYAIGLAAVAIADSRWPLQTRSNP